MIISVACGVVIVVVVMCLVMSILLIFVAAIAQYRDRPKTSLDMVKEFHLVYGHPVEETPQLGGRGVNSLRVRLIEEELWELKEGLANGNQREVFDALLDIQYVLDGAFISLGFYRAKDEGMIEVHRSNMSKLGLDGKPIYDSGGKVIKGPNYREPDLDLVLARCFPGPDYRAKCST